jgi:hypothetical protein
LEIKSKTKQNEEQKFLASLWLPLSLFSFRGKLCKKLSTKPSAVAHACTPSYLGGGD